VTGFLQASGYGVTLDCGGGFAEIDFVDSFSLIGPPLGTQVVVNAVMTWGGEGCVDIYGPAGKLGEQCNSSSSPLVVQQAMTVGTPVLLTFRLIAGGGISSSVNNGDFSLSSVPMGAAIVSCKGYVSEPGVTPARTTSWGALKLLYR